MKLPFLLSFVLLFSGSVLAQTKKSPPASSSPDARAVEAVVIRLFDAMRASDSTLARSVLAPSAKLYSVASGKDGQVLPRETPMHKFVEMIGQKHPQVLDERIWGVKVNIDGDLATLWCDYAFYIGDTFSHCGADAFQLYRSPQGWKIFSISDTRRKEGCDLKAAQAARTKP
ncbi:nuclear transport factor 2 family protein [Rufibacter immobilis]|uniref:Nuclear transport factor 2 family protein n=1 Tax=Rufibacter immobilis TaxID=1348778 RepID=A0A3M9N5G4_9BACT|nr:nuclear transport factor 2 family protein [Rufibacter immobilis]RNI32986.1 nuclear transport factor 2 family protein [Rufibacter immobilis]